MPTFIEILEEIADSQPVISISASDLEHLVQRFGSRVRQMGRWNVSTDGSLEIPVIVIRDAASKLASRTLRDALTEIKTESLSQLLDTSAAVLLIEKIRESYDEHFRLMMNQYQNSLDSAESTRLRDQLIHEVFGE